MAKLSKGVLGKTLVGLPLLALASAAWIVTLAGLAISKHEGTFGTETLPPVYVFEALWVPLWNGLAQRFSFDEHVRNVTLSAGAESDLGFLWFIWALEGFVLGFCALHLVGRCLMQDKRFRRFLTLLANQMARVSNLRWAFAITLTSLEVCCRSWRGVRYSSCGNCFIVRNRRYPHHIGNRR